MDIFSSLNLNYDLFEDQRYDGSSRITCFFKDIDSSLFNKIEVIFCDSIQNNLFEYFNQKISLIRENEIFYEKYQKVKNFDFNINYSNKSEKHINDLIVLLDKFEHIKNDPSISMNDLLFKKSLKNFSNQAQISKLKELGISFDN